MAHIPTAIVFMAIIFASILGIGYALLNKFKGILSPGDASWIIAIIVGALCLIVLLTYIFINRNKCALHPTVAKAIEITNVVPPGTGNAGDKGANSNPSVANTNPGNPFESHTKATGWREIRPGVRPKN